MKKVIMSLIVVTAISVSACAKNSSPAVISSEKIIKNSPSISAAPEQSVDSEKYVLSYIANDKAVTINEYIRNTDSLEHWTRMLTIRDYNGAKNIKDVLPSYVKQITNLKAVPIDVYVNNESQYKENAVLTTILLDPNGEYSEVVVHMFIVNPISKTVRSAVISERVYGADRKTLQAAWARRISYMQALNTVNYEIYASTKK
jgi:hypothetical protein